MQLTFKINYPCFTIDEDCSTCMEKSTPSQPILISPAVSIITEEEEKLLKFIAEIIVEQSFKKVYEKRDSLSQIQQHRSEQR